MTFIGNWMVRSAMYGLLVASVCMPAVAMGLAYNTNPQKGTSAPTSAVSIQYMIKRVGQPHG